MENNNDEAQLNPVNDSIIFKNEERTADSCGFNILERRL
jgi:hypothetical protein